MTNKSMLFLMVLPSVIGCKSSNPHASETAWPEKNKSSWRDKISRSPTIRAYAGNVELHSFHGCSRGGSEINSTSELNFVLNSSEVVLSLQFYESTHGYSTRTYSPITKPGKNRKKPSQVRVPRVKLIRGGHSRTRQATCTWKGTTASAVLVGAMTLTTKNSNCPKEVSLQCEKADREIDGAMEAILRCQTVKKVGTLPQEFFLSRKKGLWLLVGKRRRATLEYRDADEI